jgi:hypothetical protein
MPSHTLRLPLTSKARHYQRHTMRSTFSKPTPALHGPLTSSPRTTRSSDARVAVGAAAALALRPRPQVVAVAALPVVAVRAPAAAPRSVAQPT